MGTPKARGTDGYGPFNVCAENHTLQLFARIVDALNHRHICAALQLVFFVITFLYISKLYISVSL